jgi:hypothetical protein
VLAPRRWHVVETGPADARAGCPGRRRRPRHDCAHPPTGSPHRFCGSAWRDLPRRRASSPDRSKRKHTYLAPVAGFPSVPGHDCAVKMTGRNDGERYASHTRCLQPRAVVTGIVAGHAAAVALPCAPPGLPPSPHAGRGAPLSPTRDLSPSGRHPATTSSQADPERQAR